MNIFVTDSCPIKSAQNLDNKRVIKMILESAQMLSTALLFHHCPLAPYKATHLNHPCTIWARTSRANYIWLYMHFVALCQEYKIRYNRTHKCEYLMPVLFNNRDFIPNGELTPFANCTFNKKLGINYRDESNVIKAYRLYLKDRWRHDKRPPIFRNPTWQNGISS